MPMLDRLAASLGGGVEADALRQRLLAAEQYMAHLERDNATMRAQLGLSVREDAMLRSRFFSASSHYTGS